MRGLWSLKIFTGNPPPPPLTFSFLLLCSDEPCILADEPCILTDEPGVFADESCVLTLVSLANA